MPAVRELFDLQALDYEIDARSARLMEIRKSLGDDTTLVPLRSLVARLTATLQKSITFQNELDGIVSAFNERVEVTETKLYSGTVTNSRELEDLQADVSMIKRQRGEQEEQLLMALDEVEETQSELNKAITRLQVNENTWQSVQAAMTDEQARVTGELATHMSDRDNRAGTIPPVELALYEQVRKAHAGKAVARMHNNSCESCRVAVPTKQAQLIRIAVRPERCPNCGLILLAD